MVSRSSPPSANDESRLTRLVPQIDRAQRIAAMLDRWKSEDLGDEPDWEVDDIEPLAMRPHSP